MSLEIIGWAVCGKCKTWCKNNSGGIAMRDGFKFGANMSGDSLAHREGESQWHCPTAPLTPPPPSDAGTICPETEAHYKAPVARNICPGSGKWDDEGAMWYPSTTNSSGWRGACSSEVPATTTAQRPPYVEEKYVWGFCMGDCSGDCFRSLTSNKNRKKEKVAKLETKTKPGSSGGSIG